MKWLSVVATCLVAGNLSAPPAEAATVPYKDLKQLVSESAVIVLGTVTGILYEPNAKDGQVYTRVRLQQLQAVKGEHHVKSRLGPGITLSFLGGLSSDGIITELVGMPQLQLAQTYLVFLRGGKWTMNPIAGWHQGIFQAMGSGRKGSPILVTLNGEVVMGVENDRLIVKALPRAQPSPKTDAIEPELKLERRQSRQDLDRLAKELADSIYREDRAAELERADAERERAADREADSRPRDEMFRQLLGGPAMSLAEFIAAVQAIDRRVGPSSPAARVFEIEPSPYPRTPKALPPPPARGANP